MARSTKVFGGRGRGNDLTASVSAVSGDRAARTYYSMAASGHPDLVDEIILRGWLRRLAATDPGATAWVDCPAPGPTAALVRHKPLGPPHRHAVPAVLGVLHVLGGGDSNGLWPGAPQFRRRRGGWQARPAPASRRRGWATPVAAAAVDTP